MSSGWLGRAIGLGKWLSDGLCRMDLVQSSKRCDHMLSLHCRGFRYVSSLNSTTSSFILGEGVLEPGYDDIRGGKLQSQAFDFSFDVTRV